MFFFNNFNAIICYLKDYFYICTKYYLKVAFNETIQHF